MAGFHMIREDNIPWHGMFWMLRAYKPLKGVGMNERKKSPSRVLKTILAENAPESTTFGGWEKIFRFSTVGVSCSHSPP